MFPPYIVCVICTEIFFTPTILKDSGGIFQPKGDSLVLELYIGSNKSCYIYSEPFAKTSLEVAE